MPAPVTRRNLLGAAAAGAAAAVLTACGRSARSAQPSNASQPSALASTNRVSTVPPASSSAVVLPPSQKPPVSAPAVGAPAVEIGAGSRTGSALTLTFHGAGDVSIARSVLAVLAANQTRVTVLAVGTWLQTNPGIAAEIVAAGHELGNHTWTHPVLSDLSEEGIRAEIIRCRDLLQAQTGSPGTYFRQSSAQNSTALIRAVAGQAGYEYCLSYDVDGLDWTDPGPGAIEQAVSTAKAGSIVSLHLGHQQTVTALPGILSDFRRRGLRPVTAKELLS